MMHRTMMNPQMVSAQQQQHQHQQQHYQAAQSQDQLPSFAGTNHYNNNNNNMAATATLFGPPPVHLHTGPHITLRQTQQRRRQQQQQNAIMAELAPILKLEAAIITAAAAAAGNETAAATTAGFPFSTMFDVVTKTQKNANNSNNISNGIVAEKTNKKSGEGEGGGSATTSDVSQQQQHHQHLQYPSHIPHGRLPIAAPVRSFAFYDGSDDASSASAPIRHFQPKCPRPTQTAAQLLDIARRVAMQNSPYNFHNFDNRNPAAAPDTSATTGPYSSFSSAPSQRSFKIQENLSPLISAPPSPFPVGGGTPAANNNNNNKASSSAFLGKAPSNDSEKTQQQQQHQEAATAATPPVIRRELRPSAPAWAPQSMHKQRTAAATEEPPALQPPLGGAAGAAVSSTVTPLESSCASRDISPEAPAPSTSAAVAAAPTQRTREEEEQKKKKMREQEEQIAAAAAAAERAKLCLSTFDTIFLKVAPAPRCFGKSLPQISASPLSSAEQHQQQQAATQSAPSSAFPVYTQNEFFSIGQSCARRCRKELEAMKERATRNFFAAAAGTSLSSHIAKTSNNNNNTSRSADKSQDDDADQDDNNNNNKNQKKCKTEEEEEGADFCACAGRRMERLVSIVYPDWERHLRVAMDACLATPGSSLMVSERTLPPLFAGRPELHDLVVARMTSLKQKQQQTKKPNDDVSTAATPSSAAAASDEHASPSSSSSPFSNLSSGSSSSSAFDEYLAAVSDVSSSVISSSSASSSPLSEDNNNNNKNNNTKNGAASSDAGGKNNIMIASPVSPQTFPSTGGDAAATTTTTTTTTTIASSSSPASQQQQQTRSSLFALPSRGRPTKLKAELHHKVMSILSRVTPSKYSELREELLNLPIRQADEAQLGQVVDVFFMKAVQEPAFSSLYADLVMSVFDVANEEKELLIMRRSASSSMMFTSASSHSGSPVTAGEKKGGGLFPSVSSDPNAAAAHDSNNNNGEQQQQRQNSVLSSFEERTAQRTERLAHRLRASLLQKCHQEFCRPPLLEPSDLLDRDTGLPLSSLAEQQARWSSFKKRLKANVRFVGELYNRGAVTDPVVNAALSVLLMQVGALAYIKIPPYARGGACQSMNDHLLEVFVSLLEVVGPKFRAAMPGRCEQMIETARQLSASHPAARTRVLLMNLVDAADGKGDKRWNGPSYSASQILSSCSSLPSLASPLSGAGAGGIGSRGGSCSALSNPHQQHHHHHHHQQQQQQQQQLVLLPSSASKFTTTTTAMTIPLSGGGLSSSRVSSMSRLGSFQDLSAVGAATAAAAGGGAVTSGGGDMKRPPPPSYEQTTDSACTSGTGTSRVSTPVDAQKHHHHHHHHHLHSGKTSELGSVATAGGGGLPPPLSSSSTHTCASGDLEVTSESSTSSNSSSSNNSPAVATAKLTSSSASTVSALPTGSVKLQSIVTAVRFCSTVPEVNNDNNNNNNNGRTATTIAGGEAAAAFKARFRGLASSSDCALTADECVSLAESLLVMESKLTALQHEASEGAQASDGHNNNNEEEEVEDEDEDECGILCDLPPKILEHQHRQLLAPFVEQVYQIGKRWTAVEKTAKQNALSTRLWEPAAKLSSALWKQQQQQKQQHASSSSSSSDDGSASAAVVEGSNAETILADLFSEMMLVAISVKKNKNKNSKFSDEELVFRSGVALLAALCVSTPKADGSGEKVMEAQAVRGALLSALAKQQQRGGDEEASGATVDAGLLLPKFGLVSSAARCEQQHQLCSRFFEELGGGRTESEGHGALQHLIKGWNRLVASLSV